MKCLNIANKKIKRLVSTYGEVLTSKVLDNYDENKDVPSVNEFAKFVDVKYNDRIEKVKLKKELRKKLNAFLASNNFEVKTVDGLKKLTGYNAAAATDLIYKTILIRKGHDAEELLTKEVAYVAYSLLGTKNKIRTDLMSSITNMSNYDEIFAKYKKRAPNLNDYKTKELIVVDFIADAIKNNYEIPKDSYQNREANYWQIKGKYVWEKKLKYYLGKIKRFVKDLLNMGKLNEEEVGALLDDLANDILNNLDTKFNGKLSADQQLTNYHNTVANDHKAKEIIEFFQAQDVLLTGSLALRNVGTVYRSKEENVHDLDFTIPYSMFKKSLHDVRSKREKELEEADKAYSNVDPMKEVIMKAIRAKYDDLSDTMVENSDWFKKIKAKYPSLTKIRSFSGGFDGSFTWTGSIGEYDIDFFLVPNNRLGVSNDNGFQNWESIFKAKLKMGRAKDIRDFVNYIPYLTNNKMFAQDIGFRHFNFEALKKDPNALKYKDLNTFLSNEDVPSNVIDTLENRKITISDNEIKDMKNGVNKLRKESSSIDFGERLEKDLVLHYQNLSDTQRVEIEWRKHRGEEYSSLQDKLERDEFNLKIYKNIYTQTKKKNETRVSKEDASRIAELDEAIDAVNELLDKKLEKVHYQKDNTGKVRGQYISNKDSSTKAAQILINSALKRLDTLPHEYAHHYIDMFRETPIVQEALRRWMVKYDLNTMEEAEEYLVEDIGKQAVKQKGEAYTVWRKIVNFIMSLLSDKEVLQLITDSFLTHSLKDAVSIADHNYDNMGIDKLRELHTEFVKDDVTGTFAEFLSTVEEKAQEELEEAVNELVEEDDTFVDEDEEETEKVPTGDVKKTIEEGGEEEIPTPPTPPVPPTPDTSEIDAKAKFIRDNKKILNDTHGVAPFSIAKLIVNSDSGKLNIAYIRNARSADGKTKLFESISDADIQRHLDKAVELGLIEKDASGKNYTSQHKDLSSLLSAISDLITVAKNNVSRPPKVLDADNPMNTDNHRRSTSTLTGRLEQMLKQKGVAYESDGWNHQRKLAELMLNYMTDAGIPDTKVHIYTKEFEKRVPNVGNGGFFRYVDGSNRIVISDQPGMKQGAGYSRKRDTVIHEGLHYLLSDAVDKGMSALLSGDPTKTPETLLVTRIDHALDIVFDKVNKGSLVQTTLLRYMENYKKDTGINVTPDNFRNHKEAHWELINELIAALGDKAMVESMRGIKNKKMTKSGYDIVTKLIAYFVEYINSVLDDEKSLHGLVHLSVENYFENKRKPQATKFSDKLFSLLNDEDKDKNSDKNKNSIHELIVKHVTDNKITSLMTLMNDMIGSGSTEMQAYFKDKKNFAKFIGTLTTVAMDPSLTSDSARNNFFKNDISTLSELMNDDNPFAQLDNVNSYRSRNAEDLITEYMQGLQHNLPNEMLNKVLFERLASPVLNNDLELAMRAINSGNEALIAAGKNAFTNAMFTMQKELMNTSDIKSINEIRERYQELIETVPVDLIKTDSTGSYKALEKSFVERVLSRSYEMNKTTTVGSLVQLINDKDAGLYTVTEVSVKDDVEFYKVTSVTNPTDVRSADENGVYNHVARDISKSDSRKKKADPNKIVIANSKTPIRGQQHLTAVKQKARKKNGKPDVAKSKALNKAFDKSTTAAPNETSWDTRNREAAVRGGIAERILADRDRRHADGDTRMDMEESTVSIGNVISKAVNEEITGDTSYFGVPMSYISLLDKFKNGHVTLTDRQISNLNDNGRVVVRTRWTEDEIALNIFLSTENVMIENALILEDPTSYVRIKYNKEDNTYTVEEHHPGTILNEYNDLIKKGDVLAAGKLVDEFAEDFTDYNNKKYTKDDLIEMGTEFNKLKDIRAAVIDYYNENKNPVKGDKLEVSLQKLLDDSGVTIDLNPTIGELKFMREFKKVTLDDIETLEDKHNGKFTLMQGTGDGQGSMYNAQGVEVDIDLEEGGADMYGFVEINGEKRNIPMYIDSLDNSEFDAMFGGFILNSKALAAVRDRNARTKNGEQFTELGSIAKALTEEFNNGVNGDGGVFFTMNSSTKAVSFKINFYPERQDNGTVKIKLQLDIYQGKDSMLTVVSPIELDVLSNEGIDKARSNSTQQAKMMSLFKSSLASAITQLSPAIIKEVKKVEKSSGTKLEHRRDINTIRTEFVALSGSKLKSNLAELFKHNFPKSLDKLSDKKKEWFVNKLSTKVDIENMFTNQSFNISMQQEEQHKKKMANVEFSALEGSYETPDGIQIVLQDNEVVAISDDEVIKGDSIDVVIDGTPMSIKLGTHSVSEVNSLKEVIDKLNPVSDEGNAANKKLITGSVKPIVVKVDTADGLSEKERMMLSNNNSPFIQDIDEALEVEDYDEHLVDFLESITMDALPLLAEMTEEYMEALESYSGKMRKSGLNKGADLNDARVRFTNAYNVLNSHSGGDWSLQSLADKEGYTKPIEGTEMMEKMDELVDKCNSK